MSRNQVLVHHVMINSIGKIRKETVAMNSISQSWKDIIRWLEANLPEALDNLHSPASEEQIAQTEEALDVTFPDSLKTLYSLHNGEMNNWPPGVFDEGHWFMPLGQVVSVTEHMHDFIDDIPTDNYGHWKSSVEENVIAIKGPVNLRRMHNLGLS